MSEPDWREAVRDEMIHKGYVQRRTQMSNYEAIVNARLRIEMDNRRKRINDLEARIRELEALLDECEQVLARVVSQMPSVHPNAYQTRLDAKELLDKLRAAHENDNE